MLTQSPCLFAIQLPFLQYFNQLMQAEQAARRSRREEHAEDVNVSLRLDRGGDGTV